MIDAFETSVRINQNATFFTFVDAAGNEASYTYRQARLISAALARRLRSLGAIPGSTVVADVPNSPELVFLILASAYGEFSLALLDASAPEADRLSQTLSLERSHLDVSLKIDAAKLHQILGRSRQIAYRTMDESTLIEGISGSTRWERSIMGERQDVIDDTIHFAERAAHLFNADSVGLITFANGEFGASKIVPLEWAQLMSASMMVNEVLGHEGKQLWQEKLPFSSRNSVNFANRDPKSSRDSRDLRELQASTSCVWQCVYRLSHIRGFQILVRSVVGRTPLRLYESFDAELVLKDTERSHVTHISVSDRMLQDLLTVEEWRSDIQPNSRIRLAEYQCILIDDKHLDPRTVARALDLNVRVFAGYGIAETSGLMAQALITRDFHGGMKLMEGYYVHIVDADEDGFGRLAVKGPGVFNGYANASTAFTVDHYFITGHIAALYDGHIFIRNRATDMFSVDGESVYPGEIADVIRHIPGVSGVHVFGMSDATGQSYPVAVIESSNPALTSSDVEAFARPLLAGSSMPRSIHIMDVLPRMDNGKLDRRAIESTLRDQLEVRSMDVRILSIPFREQMDEVGRHLSAHATAIVRITDPIGRVGVGECVAPIIKEQRPIDSLSIDDPAAEAAYEAERAKASLSALYEEVAYLKNILAPMLVGKVLHHPREAAELFGEVPDIAAHPMAASALECAVWDLFGHITQAPLWSLLNQEYARIHSALDAGSGPMQPVSIDGEVNADGSSLGAGVADGQTCTSDIRMAQFIGNVAVVSSDAVIAYGQAPVVTANAHSAVAAGYTRLKMQITPSKGFASVRSVRRAFPDLLITLDANGSFEDSDIEQLKAYDALNIAWIEEPFPPNGVSDPLEKLNRMQSRLATPLCADESYTNAYDADRILAYKDIHCVSVKVPKFGGIEAALRFIALAKRQGKVICMGSMSETGIGRRVSAAFETLPGIVFPGDIGSISRYFQVDITLPPYEAERGQITLNSDGYPYGIGCTLNEDAISRVLVG